MARLLHTILNSQVFRHYMVILGTAQLLKLPTSDMIQTYLDDADNHFFRPAETDKHKRKGLGEGAKTETTERGEGVGMGKDENDCETIDEEDLD